MAATTSRSATIGRSAAALLAEYDGPRGGPPTPCGLKVFVYDDSRSPTAAGAADRAGNMSSFEQLLKMERMWK